MRKKLNKTEMEYEEAPSGFVTLYNYKEPFMKFNEGFGYQGVLLFDGDSEKVQCHICGKWFVSLPPHTLAFHGLDAAMYKKTVGLTPSTALVSEKFRERLIEIGSMITHKGKKTRIKKGQKLSEETKEKISASLRNVSRERENIRGTCPEQLLDRLKALHEKLGDDMSVIDVPFIQSLNRVWGSFKTACRMAGITTLRKKGKNRGIDQYSYKEFTKSQLKTILRNFYKEHGRIPKGSDLRRQIFISRYKYRQAFGSWEKALLATFDKKLLRGIKR